MDLKASFSTGEGQPGGLHPSEPLEALEPRLRDLVIERCSRSRLSPGQPLFEQGSLHTASYIVEEGLVRTYYMASSGREITLAYWSEGDLVGGPNFFGGGFHIWSGKAVRATRIGLR